VQVPFIVGAAALMLMFRRRRAAEALAETSALCEDESDDEGATILKPRERSSKGERVVGERVGERLRSGKTKPEEEPQSKGTGYRVQEASRRAATRPSDGRRGLSLQPPVPCTPRPSDGRRGLSHTNKGARVQGTGYRARECREEAADVEMQMECSSSRRSALTSAQEVRARERKSGRDERRCPAPCTHERGAGRSGGRSARSASSGLHPVPCTHERAAELKQERPLEPLEPLERPASKKKHKYESARRQLD